MHIPAAAQDQPGPAMDPPARFDLVISESCLKYKMMFWKYGLNLVFPMVDSGVASCTRCSIKPVHSVCQGRRSRSGRVPFACHCRGRCRPCDVSAQVVTGPGRAVEALDDRASPLNLMRLQEKRIAARAHPCYASKPRSVQEGASTVPFRLARNELLFTFDRRPAGPHPGRSRRTSRPTHANHHRKR